MILQDKYQNKSFEEILETSQEFVDVLALKFRKHNFIVRPYDDTMPFDLPNGEKVRAMDLIVMKRGKTCFVEAKDFGKFKYYYATGLPLSLVDKYRQIKKMSGLDCYLFFRDNKDTDEDIKDKRILKSYFKRNDIYIPYGGEIDSLQEYSISRKPEYSCKFKGSYYNELQELWKVREMQTIDSILQHWGVVELKLF